MKTLIIKIEALTNKKLLSAADVQRYLDLQGDTIKVTELTPPDIKFPSSAEVRKNMREIKFRGKKLNTDTWIFGTYVHDIELDNHYIFTGFVSHIIDSETVGQWTGLKDLSGKECYEGDIIQNGIAKWEVVFNHGCFSAKMMGVKGKKPESEEVYLSLRGIKGWTIIGNIYGIIK